MVFQNNLLAGASGATGTAPFDSTLIGNSIWLDGSADTLEKTFSSGSAQTKVVISTWVQRYSFGSDQTVFSATGGTGGSTRSNRIQFRSDDTIDIHLETSTVKTIIYSTTAVFRDIGFYHILVSIDQGQSQGPAQVKLFVNGSEVSIAATVLDQGFSAALSSWGNACKHNVGSHNGSSAFLKGTVTQTTMLVGQSIQSGDVAVSDFLDTFTFGTNGSQFIPKKDSDIAALATSAGGNSFCLDFSTASVALSSGVTPTSSAGTFSGSLSNLTDGDFTNDWRSTVDPATNVSNADISFDLGSAKDVKAVKITGRSSITGNFKVQFSDNNSDFTDTGTTFSNVSITTTANSGILDLTSDNPGSHRYWKLINISNSSGTSAWGFKEVILASVVGNLGTDASGNGNDFSLTSINSNNQSSNSPSKTYQTFNPLWKSNNSFTLTDGNTKANLASGGGILPLTKTIGGNEKVYVEFVATDANNGNFALGVAKEDIAMNAAFRATGIIGYESDGDKYVDGSQTATDIRSWSDGAVIALALDMQNRKLWIRDSTGWQGSSGTDNPEDSSTGVSLPSSIGDNAYIIFGNSAGSADQDAELKTEANSSLTYTVPSGFVTLNTANQTAPDFQGIDYFDATLYEGNGQNQRVGDFVPFTDTYTVDKSAMFDDGDRRYLARTYTASDTARSSNSQATISYWIKFCSNGANQDILTTSNSGQTDRLRHYINDQSGQQSIYMTLDGPSTNRDFEIPISKLSEQEWTNIVYNIDVDNSTAADKIKCWVNGVQQTSTDTSYQSASNADYFLFANEEHFIGNLAPAGGGYTVFCLNSYLAEMHVLDGQLKAPTDFGQVDTSTNRWVPKDYKTNVGAYGNRGFYMAFDSTFASGNGAGTDSSGNDFHFTESFVSGGSAWATTDQFVDTPSKNFATFDSGYAGGGSNVHSEGNTKVKGTDGTNSDSAVTTFGMTGKVVFDFKFHTVGGGYPKGGFITGQAGLEDINSSSGSIEIGTFNTAGSFAFNSNGNFYVPTAPDSTTYRSTVATGQSIDADDVIRYEVDTVAGTVRVYFQNEGTGSFTELTSARVDNYNFDPNFGIRPAVSNYNNSEITLLTGGQTTLSSVSTGFLEINQDNLDDTASKLTAWAWIKNRDADVNHMLFDRVRGVGKDIHADVADAEATNANTVQRFLQRGVQVGNDSKVNTAGNSFVLWQWLLGDSATTGTVFSADNPPSLASTVIAADADHFSVGTYTGDGGTSATIKHGLSATPEMIWVKNRSQGDEWVVGTEHNGFASPWNYYAHLDTTGNFAAATNIWNDTAPTSSVFTVGTSDRVNASSEDYVFYAFRSVPGVCKVGSYVGNFDHDGPYISLGFKPSFFMLKEVTTTGSWYIHDFRRSPFNSINANYILADSLGGENVGADNEIDFLSDAAKIRGQNNGSNQSGSTFVYLAMAQIGGNGTLPPIYGR